MKCKFCGFMESKVIDSRLNEEGSSIRRRRECLECGRRYTTYEVIEKTPVYVIKNDGLREVFDITKIQKGIMKACEKRPVPVFRMEEIFNDIEKQVYNYGEQEIKSKILGELVMNALKELDEVAYVRFASVHRQFKDIDTFLSEINDILKEKKNR